MLPLISILLLSTIGGQLFRIPYLQGTGILVSDFILGIIGLVWLIKLITGQTSIRLNRTNILLILFLGFTMISLLFNLTALPTHDSLISLFYFLRLFAYCCLFFIIQDYSNSVRTKAKTPLLTKEELGEVCGLNTSPLLASPWKGEGDKNRRQTNNTPTSKIYNLTSIIAVILVFLGFLQLKYFPNFEVLRMQEKGWDPHIGRMLSTWFDPNFLGGFFAFVLSLIGGFLVVRLNKAKDIFLFLRAKKNLVFTGIFFLILIALVLTYSRSSYLAFLVSMFCLTLIASRRLLLIGAIGVILMFGVSDRMQSRVIDAYETAQSIFNPYSVDTPDATARFRIQSWKDGISLFEEKPLMGHGFNTLRYIQAKRGLTEWKSHNAGGIDASLLTLLVTTGFIGLALFLSFLGSLLFDCFQNYKKSPNVLSQGLSLGYFCGILGLLVHSLFVNSLLFPFVMIFMWIFGGMLESTLKHHKACHTEPVEV